MSFLGSCALPAIFSVTQRTSASPFQRYVLPSEREGSLLYLPHLTLTLLLLLISLLLFDFLSFISSLPIHFFGHTNSGDTT